MSHPTASPSQTSDSSVASIARRARVASRAIAKLSADARNEVLIAVGQAIELGAPKILEANERDCRAAELEVPSGKMSSAMLARLRVTERGIAQMAAQVREVARLDDPLGRRLSATELDDGLVLYKESCPFGVIGVIFESRPDAVSQLASLALKSGNAILLKGGAEAAHTNEALVSIWRECIGRFPAVPADSINLFETRADVKEMLALDRDVDLIIPRGSYALVQFILQHSRIPVLGHSEGICHVYVDRAADLDEALDIAYDAKVQYPAVCNAAETLLVHAAIAEKFLPRMIAKLKEAKVEIRGDSKTIALLPKLDIVPATDLDWATEYSDLILSVKIVADLDEAIEHVNRYGSRHTDAIVTEDAEAARRFLNEVDAAGVFQNASTRFADGYRYGLGAEVGISTSKLHARGPMGLEGLTTYKYKLHGDGHTVGPYARGDKKFKHRPIP
ncbi:MAG TPA: glutamate-5-semialdehyde dehydrogenase [Candidatus Acidoferrales bacterium]|nr:glutamate-5-semialdehyde dehydrogenase [Candidatus Acidoferrales bacterium]